MTKDKSLKIILAISLIGILFSGTLSYQEVIVKECSVGCGQAGLILGLPACVYGLIMYSIVFIVALLGYKSKK